MKVNEGFFGDNTRHIFSMSNAKLQMRKCPATILSSCNCDIHYYLNNDELHDIHDERRELACTVINSTNYRVYISRPVSCDCKRAVHVELSRVHISPSHFRVYIFIRVAREESKPRRRAPLAHDSSPLTPPRLSHFARSKCCLKKYIFS